MSKKLSLLSGSIGAAAIVFLPAAAAHAEMAISIYGGAQTAPHSDVTVSGPTAPTSFNAGWEGKSFSAPPYYGARATWWLDNLNRPNLGVSLDFTHAKVYADDETLAEAGWDHFEFSDGINLLTLNALYRMPMENSKFVPYVGAGVGINIPHVEVIRPSGRTWDYQVGGMTLQAQAGVSYQMTERWSVFAEYKGNYSFVDVDIDSGDRLETDIITNAVNLGVSYHW
ncbi:porin family protein [Agrobacterium sp. a22-2]|uniref:outer membrane protein n=1 Tax=Agrobacterium sp. a22-2 TaxID=2283840 RepID=UPI0014466D50|nr:outer membrane beta-barrel protein [Agrobacterium sp. a22-2]NKN38595.1 porin family protein [Agrobacterium sp. a22-2]